MTGEQTWTFTDRSKWPAGPWDAEPFDKAVWTDEATGYACMVHRNRSGAWCGYVGVPQGHPWFGIDFASYSEDSRDIDVEVHGGITFSDRCGPSDPSGQGICHPPRFDGDEPWWLGFDCNHSGDLAPGTIAFWRRFMEHEYSSPDRGDTYKGLNYVRAQVRRLVEQAGAAVSP